MTGMATDPTPVPDPKEIRLLVAEEVDRWKGLHDREFDRRRRWTALSAFLGIVAVAGVGVPTFRSVVDAAAESAVNASKEPYIEMLSQMRSDVQEQSESATRAAADAEAAIAATRKAADASLLSLIHI